MLYLFINSKKSSQIVKEVKTYVLTPSHERRRKMRKFTTQRREANVI